MDVEKDLWEAQISAEVEKRVSEIKHQLEARQDAELESVLRNPKRMIDIYQERLKDLEAENAEYKEDHAFAVTVRQSEDWMEMSAAVKALGFKNWGRNTTFRFLREVGVLRFNNEPYQQYVDKGYFKIVEQHFEGPDGETMINRKTVISQKGLDYIRKRILKDDPETAKEYE